jgi:hypothetical protein
MKQPAAKTSPTSTAHTHAFFEAMTCPSQVTWTNDIQKLFSPLDVAHMKTIGIDLSSYQSVKINAVRIYSAVSGGVMPPPGSGEQPWSSAWVNTFGCWIKQNCPQ